MYKWFYWISVLILSCPAPLLAEIIDSSATGFTIRHEITIPAPTWQVYDHFVNDISQWWNGAHSFSHDAANLSLTAKPGGCLCEQWHNDKWVEHLRVVQVQPHQMLVLRGALGPLQGLAVTGSMTISFVPTSEGMTRLSWTYAVGGYTANGLQAWAAPVDRVIGEQFTRLVSYVSQQRDNK